MKAAGVGLAIVLALAVQTTLARFVISGGVRVDLVLVVVVYIALTSGSVTGAWTGAVGGIAQDALSGGLIGVGGLAKTIVGVGGLAKTIVGFVVGVTGSQFIVARPLHRFVVFVAASLAHAVCFHGLYVMLPSGGVGASATAVLGEALANALVGVVAFQLIEFGPGMLERRRIQRSRVLSRRLGGWR